MDREEDNAGLAAENRRLTEEVTDLRRRLACIQDEHAKPLDSLSVRNLNARLEQSLAHKRFRYDVLSFLLEHPDVNELVDYIARHLLTLSGCDRVSFGGDDGSCRIWTREGFQAEVFPCFDTCPLNPLSLKSAGKSSDLYIPDVRRAEGWTFPAECCAKSIVSVLVQDGDHPCRRITLYYMQEHHQADEYELHTLDSVVNIIKMAFERQRLIAAQAAERDHAIAAERAKTEFFASVSHDIRTPLNSIIGFSELLKSEANPAVRQEYLDSITFSGNTLLELVNDVLDIAKLDAGNLSFEHEPFDLGRQIHLLLRTFESTAREKRLSLQAEIGDLPVIELDEHRIRQVLFNLVGNAVKYTDAGSVTVSTSFDRTDARKGVLRIAVRDTGIGIATEDISKLMRPYVRLQGVNARGGTGLGLAICKRIVEGMGGQITISSEQGKGSVFAVLLPDVAYQGGPCLSRPLTPPGGPCLSRPRGSNPSPTAVTSTALPDTALPSDFSALRVLVVDDLEINRRVLVACCRRLGIQHAAGAESGAEALDILEKEEFDLMLTDMKMPGIDGGELIRAVRERPRVSRLPIFLVTADIEAQKYYKSFNANGVLLKPVVLARLAETLSAVCETEAGDG